METGLGSEEDTILYYRSLTSVERWESSQWTLRKSPVHLGLSVRNKISSWQIMQRGGVTAPTAPPLAMSLIQLHNKQ